MKDETPEHMTRHECLDVLSHADIEPRPEYKRRVWRRLCLLNGIPSTLAELRAGKAPINPAVQVTPSPGAKRAAVAIAVSVDSIYGSDDHQRLIDWMAVMIERETCVSQLLAALHALLDDVAELDDESRAKFGGLSDQSVSLANAAISAATKVS